MKPLKQQKTVYVIVEVYSGIPDSVKLFNNKKLAKKYEHNLRKHINLEEDETGIFQVSI